MSDDHNLDAQFTIARNVPLLEQVEGFLQVIGRRNEAERLNKLQQDAGVQIALNIEGEQAFEGLEKGSPAEQLRAAYEPVTPERIQSTLTAAYQLMPAGKKKNEMQGVMQELNIGVGPSRQTPENFLTRILRTLNPFQQGR